MYCSCCSCLPEHSPSHACSCVVCVCVPVLFVYPSSSIDRLSSRVIAHLRPLLYSTAARSVRAAGHPLQLSVSPSSCPTIIAPLPAGRAGGPSPAGRAGGNPSTCCCSSDGCRGGGATTANPERSSASPVGAMVLRSVTQRCLDVVPGGGSSNWYVPLDNSVESSKCRAAFSGDTTEMPVKVLCETLDSWMRATPCSR